MKVIVLATGQCNLIGSYTLEGFSKYLKYHIDLIQIDNSWLAREHMVFIMKCDFNFKMWSTEWGCNDCTYRINCTKNSGGKYLWCICNQEYTSEELVTELERLMIDDDNKVKQLEEQIAAYKKHIEYLENHIKYMPQGDGAIEAKEHFISLAERD